MRGPQGTVLPSACPQGRILHPPVPALSGAPTGWPFARRPGEDRGFPAGNPPPILFCLDKRECAAAGGRENRRVPNLAHFVQGLADTGVVRIGLPLTGGPADPAPEAVPRRTAPPHPMVRGRDVGAKGNWRILTPARSAPLRAAGALAEAVKGCAAATRCRGACWWPSGSKRSGWRLRPLLRWALHPKAFPLGGRWLAGGQTDEGPPANRSVWPVPSSAALRASASPQGEALKSVRYG